MKLNITEHRRELRGKHVTAVKQLSSLGDFCISYRLFWLSKNMALEVLCKCLCPAESLNHRGQIETQIKTMG